MRGVSMRADVVTRIAIIPLGFALGGCALFPDEVTVEVHNRTDAAIVVRDAGWRLIDEGHAMRAGGTCHVLVTVWAYDADVEVEADGLRREYDLDIAPFEWWEDLHVHEDDFAPTGGG